MPDYSNAEAMPLAASPATDPPPRVAGFRLKLFAGIMLVVAITTALALYFTERNLAASVESDLELEFQSELAVRHNVQQARHAALVERCRALVRRSRIQASIEDDALDLLYLNAEDELRDIMATKVALGPEEAAQWLHATFYRFLDRHGAVITP